MSTPQVTMNELTSAVSKIRIITESQTIRSQLPVLDATSRRLWKDLQDYLGNETIRAIRSNASKLTKAHIPQTMQCLTLSGRILNNLTQNSLTYGYNTTIGHNTTSVSFKIQFGNNSYTFKDSATNSKESNQIITRALACIMVAESLRPTPQSGVDMTPEDSLLQTEKVNISENTSITQAVEVIETPFCPTENFLQEQATTTEKYAFEQLTQRWICVTSGTFTAGDMINQIIVSLPMPSAIYANIDSSTSSPLRPFALIKTDIEVNVKINSNQAQAGRYICAFYPCREQAPDAPDSVYMNVQREHAEINISSSADVLFTITYENLRPFLPIQANEIGGLTGDSFGIFTIRCLSPVNVVADGEPSVPYQVLVRLKNPYLTAMRYPIPTTIPTALQKGKIEPQSGNRILSREEIEQQLIAAGVESNPGPIWLINKPQPQSGAIAGSPTKAKVIEGVKDVTSAAKSIPVFGTLFKWMTNVGANIATSVTRLVASEQFTRNLENNLIYVGLKNKDKPVDVRPNIPFQPIAQKPLCHGLGPILATKMRLEHTSNTAHTDDFCTIQTTESYKQLARIGGIQNVFSLNTTQVNGDLLTELPVAPFDPRYLPPSGPVGIDSGYFFPPVSYFANMFQGYSGQIEYEFIPVKTSQHNFSIMVAFVPFHGTPGTTTFEQAQSCEYKIIDFRAQDTGVFTVPWVCTSLFRQYPGVDTALGSYQFVNTTQPPTQMQWKDPGKICVFLINPLNVTPIVSPNISVIVKMRAAENFQYIIPTPMRLASIVGMNPYVLPPTLVTSGTFAGNPVPQSGLQIQSVEELQGDKVRPVIGPQIQTMEIHDDINNVLRRSMYYLPIRPTYYTETNGTTPIAGSPIAAEIPIVISDPAFATSTTTTALPSDSMNMRFSRSPRDATVACFRWYRGGATLSLINHSEHNYIITYIPPMKRPVWMNGFNRDTGDIVTYPLAAGTAPSISGPDSLGYASLRNVPSVNRVTDVEVPFYGTNNFYDIQSRFCPARSINHQLVSIRNMRLGPLYDVVACTLGSVLITAERYPTTAQDFSNIANDSSFTSKLSLADDGKLYHFMGCPPMKMTSLSNPIPQSGIRIRTKKEIQTALIASGIESNPGPVYIPEPQGGVSSYLPNVSGFLASVKTAFSTMTNLPSKITEATETGKSLTTMMTSIQERFKTALALFTDIPLAQIIAMTGQFVVAIQHPSTLTVLMALVTFMYTIGVFANNLKDKLIEVVTSLLGTTIKPEGQNFESPHSPQHYLAGFIGAGIVEFFCVKSKIDDFPVEQKNSMYENVRNKVKRILSNVNYSRVSTLLILIAKFSVLLTNLTDTAYTWFSDKFGNPRILGREKMIANFMKDYNYIMNVLNENSYTALRKDKDRFWVTLYIAMYLQNYMVRNNIKNPSLGKCVSEIIKKASTLGKRIQALPVRYEPYVLWAYGERGLGKSFIMQGFMHKMIAALKKDGIDIQHPNPMYTRNPAIKYWNGYTDQPIVYYDDFGAVQSSEIDTQLLSDFISMKSPSPFPLDMADIADKHATMNSMLCGVCSNFPTLDSSVIRDTEAFDRRRNAVVRLVFSDEAKKIFKDNNIQKGETKHLVALAQKDESIKKLLSENGHLLFQRFNNVIGLGRKSTPTPDKTMTYQQFETEMCAEYRQYHAIEVKNMVQRYKEMLSLMPEYVKTTDDMSSCQAAVMEMTFQVANKFSGDSSENLKELLLKLEEQTPEYWKTLALTTQEQIDFLRNTKGESGYGNTIIKFPNNEAARGSGEWILSKLGKRYKQDVDTWSGLDDIYNKMFSWKTPLENPSIVLEEEVICMRCLKSTQTPSFICPKSQAGSIHVYCDCIIEKKQPTCQHCHVVMEPLSPEVKNMTYSTAARFLVATRKFLSESWRQMIAKDCNMKESYSKRIRQLMISAYLLIQQMPRKEMTTLPVTDKDVMLKAFIEYTGVYPTNVKMLSSQSPKTAYYAWPIDDKAFCVTLDATGRLNIAKTNNRFSSIIPQSGHNSDEEQEQSDYHSDEEEYEDEDPEFSGVFQHCKMLVKECLHVGFKHTYEDTLQHVPYLERFPEPQFKSNDKITYYTHDNTELYSMAFFECCKLENDMYVPICKYWDQRKMKKEFNRCKDSQLEYWKLTEPSNWPNHYDFNRGIVINRQPELHEETQTEEEIKLYESWREQLLIGIPTRIFGAFSGIYMFLKEHIYLIMSLFAMAIASMYGYKTYYCADNQMVLPTVELQSEHKHLSRKNARKPRVRALNTRASDKATVVEMQSLSMKEVPRPVLEAAESYKKNVGLITFNGERTFTLGIKDTSLVIPLHAWRNMDFVRKTINEQSFKYTSNDGTEHLIKWTDCEVKESPTYELAFLTLPRKGIACFKNISRRAFPKYDSYGTEIVHCLAPTAYVMDLTDSNIKITSIYEVEFDPVLDTVYYCNDQYLEYRNDHIDEWITTSIQKRGMCMSPYMDINGHIFGLHVAGSGGYGSETGYAVPFYKEVIGDALGHDTVTAPANSVVRTVSPQVQSGFMDHSNLTYEYTILDAPYHTHETKILPSPLQSYLYDPRNEPCIQSRTDPRYEHGGDPLLDGVATIGNKTYPVDFEIGRLCQEAVSNELITHMRAPYIQPPVSTFEALTAEKAPNASSMNTSTSAGYPLNKRGAKRSLKKDFINTKTRDLDEGIKKDIERDFETRCKGINVGSLFWAHLKDETRPKEKLRRKGGTRVFSVSSLELNINSRRILQPFMDSFYINPIDLHHAITLNPTSQDWMELYSRAKKKGNKLILLDYKNFSDSLPTSFVYSAFEIVLDYYRKHNVLTDEIQNAIVTIAEDIAHSRILVYDDVYKVNNGVLAGHPLTSIINSIVNLLILCFVWIKITRCPPSEFFRLCFIMVMGDDVFISCPDSVIELGFTCDNMCKVLKRELNIVATDGNKNVDNIEPFVTFDQFEFLSRTAVPHPYRENVMLAPLKTNSLFEVPLWIHKGDTEERIKESIQQTLLLSYDHGPIFFEKIREMLVDTPETPSADYYTWQEIDSMFHGKELYCGEKMPKASQEYTPYTWVNLGGMTHTGINGTQKMPKASRWATEYELGCKQKTNVGFPGMMRSVEECKCRYDCMSELQKREEEIAARKSITKINITYQPARTATPLKKPQLKTSDPRTYPIKEGTAQIAKYGIPVGFAKLDDLEWRGNMPQHDNRDNKRDIGPVIVRGDALLRGAI